MKITRPTPDRLLLTEHPHYVLLLIGLLAVGGGAAMLARHSDGWQTLLFGGLLWFGCSSGHGTMLLDRSARTIATSKLWWGLDRRLTIPFSNVRYAESARARTNTYFRLVLRGGGTFSLVSSANLINNSSQAADVVNEFLGVYAPGAAPPIITAATAPLASAPAPVQVVPLPAAPTLAQKAVADPALKAELQANCEAILSSDALRAALADGAHTHTPEELRALKAAGQVSILSLESTPSGATISVDGLSTGTTPLAFVLRRKDQPRTIAFVMPGYQPVDRQVSPDGKDLQLTVALQPIGRRIEYI